MTLTNYHYLKYNLIHDLDKNTLNLYSISTNIKNIISAVIWGIKDNTSRFIGHEVPSGRPYCQDNEDNFLLIMLLPCFKLQVSKYKKEKLFIDNLSAVSWQLLCCLKNEI